MSESMFSKKKNNSLWSSSKPVQRKGLFDRQPFAPPKDIPDDQLPDLQTRWERAKTPNYVFQYLNPQPAPTPAVDTGNIQRQEDREEDQIQTLPLEHVQLQEAPGEKPSEDLQASLRANIQPQENQQQDENIQTLPLAQVQLKEAPGEKPSEDLQALPSADIQRQETQEDENLQTKPLALQLQETEEKPEEDLQALPLSNIQRQETQEEDEIQAKLTVGAPGDKYEQEADQMAAKVMAMPEPQTPQPIQRQTGEEEEVQMKPLAQSITPLIQRQTAEGEESEEVQMLQRKGNGSFSASSNVESSLNGSKGGGSPLADNVRGFMESRFGTDFSSVRVHTDFSAVQMNKELGAAAFAHGNDIYYGAGKSPGKDELTAHELTHTIQQTGGLRLNKEVRRQARKEEESIAAKQLSISTSPLTNNKDRQQKPATEELEQTSESLQPKQLSNYPSLQNKSSIQPQPLLLSEVSPRIQGGWLDNPAEQIKGKIAEFARRIPGYGLLTLILGKDPVSSAPVERNATNLIRGLLSLVPNGENIFNNLEQSGALQRAFNWFNQEVTKLNLSIDAIKGLFGRALQSLGVGDALNPVGAFEKIKNVFTEPIVRIKNFAVAAGSKVMEFAFEGFLNMAGGAGGKVMGIIRNAGGAIANIVKNPVGFAGNLAAGAKGGFHKFASNMPTHLKNGMTGWLFGAMAGTGLALPAQFDLKGIVSLVLQVLGLTYEKLRGKLIQVVGEPRVKRLEQAFDFLKTIVTGGLAAAWQKITEFAGNLQEMVIGGIREWVQNSIITAAITKLISMFNPAGAVVQAVMAIYNTIMFFIERGEQIAALSGAVFASIGNIAAGNVAGAANYVEQAMARSLPVMISFLARLIGLGGIGEHIKNVIKKIHAPIDNSMNKLASFILEKGKSLLGTANKDKEGKKAEKTDDGESVAIAFSMNGSPHTLTLKSGSTAKVLMASNNPGLLSEKINTAIDKLKKSDTNQPQVDKRLKALEDIENRAMEVEKTLHNSNALSDDKKKMKDKGMKLVQAISQYGKEYGVEDIEEALKLYPAPVVGLYNNILNDKTPTPDGTTREAHHAPPFELAQTLSEELLNASKAFLKKGVVLANDPFEQAANNINNAEKNLPAIMVHASTHRIKGVGSRIHGSEIRAELTNRLEKDNIAQEEAIINSKNQLLVKAGNKAYKRYIDKKVKLALTDANIDAIKLAFKKAYNTAAAQTLYQVAIALEVSKFDGSDKDRETSVKSLRTKANEVWKGQLLKPLD